MLYDTTILIDFDREITRGQSGAAAAFILKHHSEEAYLSVISVAEYAIGFPAEFQNVMQKKISNYNILNIDEATAWIASRLERDLKQKGQSIGDNDIWIAATALQHQLPLVTNNQSHFARIPNLEVFVY